MDMNNIKFFCKVSYWLKKFLQALLAETEGIFTETAGGVTVGVTQKLVQQGRIKPDEVTVICITGNGLKTQEALADHFPKPQVMLQWFPDELASSSRCCTDPA